MLTEFLVLSLLFGRAASPAHAARLGQDLRRYLQERKENKGTKSVDMACQVRERLESARVVICGYGRVGTLVAQLLDTKFVPWVAFDVNERIVAEARAKDTLLVAVHLRM